jgi:monothiol glutaredoxin
MSEQVSENPIFSAIEGAVASDDVVLFMKGDPQFPQCGFSAAVVEVLNHMNVPYNTYDVLQSAELRDGIKAYSDWPTIPQLYVKGELVGGCDIVREMYESGELKTLYDDKGLVAQG